MIISLFLAFLSLLWMGWIDLKLWILPNELVALLACMAIPYHMAALPELWLSSIIFMGIGAIVGGGVLWVIRAVANRIYGMETMGLGDVKLMAAGGLWLGAEGILMALSIGALCGVLHAVSLAVIHKKSLNRMMLPAGPGFIAGLIIVGYFYL